MARNQDERDRCRHRAATGCKWFVARMLPDARKQELREQHEREKHAGGRPTCLFLCGDETVASALTPDGVEVVTDKGTVRLSPDAARAHAQSWLRWTRPKKAAPPKPITVGQAFDAIKAIRGKEGRS